MTAWNVLEVIGVTVGVLSWVGITPKVLAQFLSKNRPKLILTGQIIIASLFSLFVLFFFLYVPIVFQIFSLASAVLLAMLAWALLGVWLPLLRKQRFWNRRFARFIELLGASLLIFVMAGFWILRWPEWQIPALLTTLVAAGTVFYVIDWLRRPDINKKEGT